MLEIIIKEASSMREHEKKEAEQVGNLAFADQNVEDLGWCAPQWLVMGYQAGRLVSLLGLLRREIRVGEQVVCVGGVGGVATHPDFQRQGYAGLILQRAAQFMRDSMQVSFGLLVCSAERVPYYGKFGWQPVTASMYFDFQGGKRVFTDPVMYLPLSEKAWPQGDLDLQGGPW